jgi:hypothetical protein
MTTIYHNRPKTRCPVLPSCLRGPAPFTRVYPGNLLLAVATAAPCSPVQCLVPITQLQMLSTVPPSSPVRTPTLRQIVHTTCPLANRSSIAVAKSNCLSEVQPHSECVSSLAVIQVHSPGIPDGLRGPLPPRPLTLWFQSQKSNALQVEARIPGLVPS